VENFLKYILLPSNLIMFGGVVGAVLLCARKTRIWGIRASLCTLMLYLVIASGPVAFLLLGGLEYQISPATEVERKDVNIIVVLAAYAENNRDIPVSSRVSSGTAYRLLETIALFEAAPEATVVVSGGGVAPAAMQEVLVSAGIPSGQIVVDGDSYSTFESAMHLRQKLGTRPFLLVTSAGHMPRAFGVFRKAGMASLAVPTHFLTKRNWLAIQYLPSPQHLTYSDLALSEYGALLWYSMKGWI
jgi:uncharacterized SAM-binding protein YcdF (DUF218 family)